MAIYFRNNCDIQDFGVDYHKIRSFLLELENPNYPFGRWDWMVTHRNLNKNGLSKIGIWEDDGQIVAIATYDCKLGKSYFCIKEGYNELIREMLLYSKDNLCESGQFKVLVRDTDTYFQDIATKLGFVATDSREHDSIHPLDTGSLSYELPEGFTITSMAENYDYCKYRQVLWKGFNHELNGEGVLKLTKEQIAEGQIEMLRPNVNLDIKVAVVTPDGNFASYCGMWFDPSSDYALVEPVATDPSYRKMGLGRAVVLEGIKRCKLLGAKKALVGSNQQFYYSIGFRPYITSTWWQMR